MSDIKITLQAGEKKRLLTKDKYCDSDIVVSSEGTMLPELTDAGIASDLLAGKQLIDGDGNVVTGSMPTLTRMSPYMPIPSVSDSGTYYVFTDTLWGKGYVSNPTGAISYPKTGFGDATPDQVLKGVTFTSANGINVEGTYEPSYELYGSYVLAEHPNISALPSSYENFQCDGNAYSFFLTAEGDYMYEPIDYLSITNYDITIGYESGLKAYIDLTGSWRWMYLEYNSTMDSGPEPIESDNKRHLVIDFKEPLLVTKAQYDNFMAIIDMEETPFDIGVYMAAEGFEFAENMVF